MTITKTRGFTLIEIMIVVLIISVIAGIALPSYNNSVRKARRSDAQQLMLDTANRQEQYLLDARAYTDDYGNLGVSKEGWSCTGDTCTGTFYTVTIAITGATPPAYSITATATGDQVPDGNLSLNSQGTKTPSDKW